MKLSIIEGESSLGLFSLSDDFKCYFADICTTELKFVFGDGSDRRGDIEEALQETVLWQDIDADGSKRVAVGDALDPGGDGVLFGLLVNLIESQSPGSISRVKTDRSRYT